MNIVLFGLITIKKHYSNHKIINYFNAGIFVQPFNFIISSQQSLKMCYFIPIRY